MTKSASKIRPLPATLLDPSPHGHLTVVQHVVDALTHEHTFV